MKTDNRQKGSVGIITVIIVLALILAGVIFFTRKEEITQENTAEENSEIVIEASPTPDQESVIAVLTGSTDTQQAVLVAVDGSDSLGVGLRLVQDGKLYHAVIANMPDPEEGNFYEGWLVQPNPLQFFSTGVMEKDVEGQWTLEFSAEQEYPTYLRVVITEETVKDDTPEAHIIEGDF